MPDRDFKPDRGNSSPPDPSHAGSDTPPGSVSPAADPPLLVGVDDDCLQLRMLEKVLPETGARCVFFRDPRQALEAVGRLRPDVVLTDWIMPEIDGLEVIRRIKSSPELRSTWIILLSARGSLDDRVQGLEVGADDYLPKPFEGRELVARVRCALRIRALERELRHAERDAALLTVACTLGHQLNNPLVGILGTLQLVEDERARGGPVELERHLEVLRASAERIRDTVERLSMLRTPDTRSYVDALSMLDLD